jgi:outer membrane receptor protein involved in Fe transport
MVKGTSNDKLRLSILAALSLTATAPVSAQSASGASSAASSANTQGTAAQGTATQGTVAQNTTPQNTAAQGNAAAQDTAQPPAAPAANQQTSLDTIIVTGVTSQRTVLNSSVDVTPIDETQIGQKAPRSTADVLQLIPGVFVESTAGPVSNNYSVRGLPGGAQTFIMLQEDGMPVLYGGGGDDEYFQNDITIGHVEALQGGTSAILGPNGAGMSVNFISRPLNFDEGEGIAKLMAATFGEQRADFYYSAPIKALGDGVAFMVGGYLDSDQGQRSNPFTYSTYHIKAALEKKWDDGAFVKVTYKRWDEHDPYYADQPYRYVNGQVGGVPGLSTQYGNVLGPGFASIGLPDSTGTGTYFRDFNGSEGIHATGNQYRIDLNVPIGDQWTVFARSRFLQSNWDFNGIFPGSGTGNQGIGSALSYLTPGAASPINSLLTAGLAAFPGATQFGIRNLTTGQITPASNVAALNAINGNGLLQQTILNHQYLATHDLGNDFGAKWNLEGNGWSNSLTLGGMYYRVWQSNDQTGVATLINGVSNSSSIYDIEALNAAGKPLGSLTNNGLESYGDWGGGLWSNTLNSFSEYFNDEMALLDKKLHIDFGLRHEDVNNVLNTGNPFAVNPPVPAGLPGVVPNLGTSFNGTFTRTQATAIPTSWTVGVNYEILPYLSVYGRYADGNQTNGGNNLTAPTRLSLSEAGVRFEGYGLTSVLTYFHTNFNNQTYQYIQPNDPAIQGSVQANLRINGVDVDLTYRPTFQNFDAFSIRVNATYQQPKLADVNTGEFINGEIVNNAAAAQYNGNIVQRTPQVMYAIQPSYDLPNRWGDVYLRYEYTGKIFTDVGNGLALPGYGVLSVGSDINFTDRMHLNLNVWNVTNALGLTEGNPNSGITETVGSNGYFYARGIAGTNATATLTYKF